MHPRPQFSSTDAVVQGLSNSDIAAAEELHKAEEAAWIHARYSLKTSAEFRSSIAKSDFDHECRSVLVQREITPSKFYKLWGEAARPPKRPPQAPVAQPGRSRTPVHVAGPIDPRSVPLPHQIRAPSLRAPRAYGYTSHWRNA